MIQFNVSGVTEGFRVSTKLLTSFKNSVFEAMFSGRHEIQKNSAGEVVIDSDPVLFRTVLSYI